MIKVTYDDVMGDDLNSPFWKSIMSDPDYPKFEQDIAYILDQSNKHSKPFNDIDPDLIDPYDWKLK